MFIIPLPGYIEATPTNQVLSFTMAESEGAATNNTYTLLPKRLEPLEMTNSPFPGSLAVLMDSREECCGYAVVSNNKVTIVRWMNGQIQHNIVEPFSNGDDNRTRDGLTLVTGVKWCYLVSGETLLVITSFAGFTVSCLVTIVTTLIN